jgi:hypothetical protein
MGRYEEIAQRIAKQIVACHREKTRYGHIKNADVANTLAANLQELAADVNAALRARKLDEDMGVKVFSAEKQRLCTVLRVSVANGHDLEDVLVTISPDGKHVMVAGRPVLKGDSPTDAICREIVRWLT